LQYTYEHYRFSALIVFTRTQALRLKWIYGDNIYIFLSHSILPQSLVSRLWSRVSSGDKAAAFLFVSHFHSENSCARADIMETNRRGKTTASPSHLPLPFSYVVFDLGWIDDTRDAGGWRHHQQARWNAVLTSGEWEHHRERERKKVGGSGFDVLRKSRGSLRKPWRDPSSLRDVEVHEGLSPVEGWAFCTGKLSLTKIDIIFLSGDSLKPCDS